MSKNHFVIPRSCVFSKKTIEYRRQRFYIRKHKAREMIIFFFINQFVI